MMSNPVLIDCPAETWTKVATGVLTGNIYRVKTNPRVYLQTVRDTGEPAPTNLSEGVPMFKDYPNREEVSSNVAIDIYIYPRNKAGKVRVDL